LNIADGAEGKKNKAGKVCEFLCRKHHGSTLALKA
jgi:hypothetical protein